MKILVDIRPLSPGRITGIEEYTIELLNHFLKVDKNNTYLLFYNAFRKGPLPEHWKMNDRVSVINWRIPNKVFDPLNMLLGLPKLDRIFKSDIIFSPHYNLLSKTRQTPHIMTFHDVSSLHHPEFFPLRKRYWMWSQNYKKSAERANAIIADSEFTKWDLVEMLNISPEKITTIYPGVNKVFSPMQKDSEKLVEFKNNRFLQKPFILYLGTVEPRKNVNALIRAFNGLKKDKTYKDFQLIIAGELGWLYRSILKEAKKSPYRNSIRFLGRVPNEDKQMLYNLSEVFVFPSFFEGFGFPPLEAQACGTPVIAADRTSLPEILGDSAMLISPWKVEEIVNALKIILSNNSARGALITKGLENAKKYSWDKTAQQTLDVFQKAAKKNANASGSV